MRRPPKKKPKIKPKTTPSGKRTPKTRPSKSRNPPRAKTPTQTETAVLTKSRRRCCLCFHLLGDYAEKSGQIAHVNRDHSDSAEENLVWLCLNHHDRYDSKTSQSKGYTPEELKFARERLYDFLRKFDAAVNETGVRQAWLDEETRRMVRELVEDQKKLKEQADATRTLGILSAAWG